MVLWNNELKRKKQIPRIIFFYSTSKIFVDFAWNECAKTHNTPVSNKEKAMCIPFGKINTSLTNVQRKRFHRRHNAILDTSCG